MKRYGRRDIITRKSGRGGKIKAKFVDNKDRNTTKETTLKLNIKHLPTAQSHSLHLSQIAQTNFSP